MFAVIDLTNEEMRPFEKWRKHGFQIDKIPITGGFPYFTVKCHGIYSDFYRLENLIQQFSGVVFKYGKAPENLKKYEYIPKVLPLKMLAESVCAGFEELPEEKRNTTVCVFDRYGKICSYTERLAKSVRFVKVITDRTDIYSRLGSDIIKSCGADIGVYSDIHAVSENDFVVALSDAELPLNQIGCGTVFYKKSFNDNIFCPEKCSFNSVNENYPPDGVDNLAFFSALNELCEMKISVIPVFSDVKSFIIKLNA